MNQELIKIELTQHEADCFVAFRKNQELFEILLQAGVFKTKGGKAVLHFDKDGEIVQVSYDFIGWKK